MWQRVSSEHEQIINSSGGKVGRWVGRQVGRCVGAYILTDPQKLMAYTIR